MAEKRPDDIPASDPATPIPPDPAIAEEARQFAREAIQEMKQGHSDEARLVIDEARQMDPKAVEDVLQQQDKTGQR
jgi:hypothetical protein